MALAVTAAAKGGGVSRNTLTIMLNVRLSIWPEMTICLPKGFRSSWEGSLQQQMRFNLWRAQQRKPDITVEKCKAN